MTLLTRALWWLVPGLLLAAAAYEVALALGAVSIGREPGQGAPGEEAVEGAMLLVMVVGACLAVAAARRRCRSGVIALYAPAAAAFLVTRFYSYDPYYAPSLRRYSDGGVAAPELIFAYAVGAAAVGLAAWFVPREGAVATAVALPLIAIMTIGIGVGH
jgi:hypothetical protein